MAKVRITKTPKGGTQRVRISSLPNQIAPIFEPGNMSTPEFGVAKTLKPVPRSQANIEAEKGETILVPDKEGLPAHFNIGGNRHSNGGTPLNVTKDSFVFSDTKKLRIKDPEVLAEFGKSKGSYTPAELAKKYDINKFRKILQDPDSDPIMVSTAEKMISNYNLKLAKLALVQEAKKGFPQGIPEVAMPYLATYNVNPDQILPLKQRTEDTGYEEIPKAKWGMQLNKAQLGNLPSVSTMSRTPEPPFDPSNPYYYEGRQSLPVGPHPGFEMSDVNSPGYGWNYPAPPPVAPFDWMNIPKAKSDSVPTRKDTANPALDYWMSQGYSREQALEITGKSYGGSLPTYQKGGTYTPSEEERKRAARIGTPKSKPITKAGKAKVAGPTVSPYGDPDTEAFLKKFGVAPEDMVYDPIGHQSKSTLGLTDQQVYEKWRRGNPKFIAEFEKEGKKFNPEDPEHMKSYEKYHKDYTYNGIYNALKKKGVKDETAKRKAEETANKLSFIDKKGVVNDADQKWGNYHRTRREFNFDDPQAVEAVVEVAKDTKKPITEPGPIAGLPAQYMQSPSTAPWWIQDVINTASAAGTRLGLKKYLPWAPPVRLETPRPTFFDPTRELAANAEQLAIGTQGAGLFAGPQAYNARTSQLQGAAARNAANILASYHGRNVGVANQFENLRTGIMNKEAMMNADSARRLYDQTTVANQQFDNAKRQANNELRQAYVNAITNRAQAQTLNELYPHYQVDPMSGGFTTFDRGSQLLPGRGNQTLGEQAADINTAASQAGWTTDQMLNYIGRGSKQDRREDKLYEYQDNPYALNADYLRQRNAVIPTMGNYGYEE